MAAIENDNTNHPIIWDDPTVKLAHFPHESTQCTTALVTKWQMQPALCLSQQATLPKVMAGAQVATLLMNFQQMNCFVTNKCQRSRLP